MTKSDLSTLLRFNRWANATLLQTAAQLDPPAFTRDLKSSHRSVRDTLTHILWGEWIWLQRWQEISPTEVFDPTRFPTVESLREAWKPIEDEQLRFLEHLRDEQLDQVLAYRNLQGELWRYPLRSMIQHVVNHSTYHRGQLVTLLRQLGLVPPPTDFLVFMDIHGS